MSGTLIGYKLILKLRQMDKKILDKITVHGMPLRYIRLDSIGGARFICRKKNKLIANMYRQIHAFFAVIMK